MVFPGEPVLGLGLPGRDINGANCVGKENLMACGSEISVSKSQGPGEASGPGGALAESQTFFLAPLIQPVSLTTQGLSSSPAQRGPEDPLTLSLSCLSIGKAWQFIQGLEVLSRAKRHQGGG